MNARAATLLRLDDATPSGALTGEASVLVVGNFDGVHRGHQSVLDEAVAAASAPGLTPCGLTFDPHPGAVVGVGTGGAAPSALTTLERAAPPVGALGGRPVDACAFA